MIYLNLETGECRKEVSDIELIKAKYQLRLPEDEFEKEYNNLFKRTVKNKDLFIEIPDNGIKLEGNNKIINMGIVNNDTIKKDLETINLGKCANLLRVNLDIINPEQNLLYQSIDLKFEDDSNRITFYSSEFLDKPKNISYCENQNITHIRSIEDFEKYINKSKHRDFINHYYNMGLDMFNAHSPIYNDPCYPLTTIDKLDMTLKERIEYMLDLDFSI